MGIPYLTKHLLPHAEDVLLDGTGDSPEELPRVRSVVIDGPSLVYHVYYRILAWTDPACDILDVQPTCDKVSLGVLSYLLQLAKAGVEIHRICFDGALPVFKRETRLSRIEKSRRRLELSRRKNPPPFTSEYREAASIQPGQVWRSRSLPTRWKNLPENPFMVSAVYEDLRHRWNKERISKEVHGEFSHHLADAEYPWASITVMVPGEADHECAREARLTGSAVLTNDSDLLLHDLGPRGAVVFLDSMHMPGSAWDPIEAEIRGLKLCPDSLSRRLGIVNLWRFAYELKRNPQLGVAELVRRSKEDTTEHPTGYQDFLQEYQDGADEHLATRMDQLIQPLDPRVSELFWQYERPDVYCSVEQPRIYLEILNEDHARRCAWEQGRFYRSLGYSLLNISRPAVNRFTVVYEYLRRGGRIVADQVTLGGTKTVVSDLDSLQRRLDLARIVFGDNLSSSNFWVLFGLSEIYRDASNATTAPNAVRLERFLGKGPMAKRTEWADIHLLAQVQAVLYSLRMLKQLLDITTLDDDFLIKFKSTLADLPPLYIMMRSRYEMIQSFSDEDLVHGSVCQIFKTYR